MIFFHCGWPKTGTTSLQAAFVRHEAALAAAGILYPRKWRREYDGSHFHLVDLLRSVDDSPRALEEFKRFLEEHMHGDVLFSSETLGAWVLNEELTRWLLKDHDRGSLARVLKVAQESAPVTCIWTLRRFDEVVHSLYLQIAMVGFRLPPPEKFMAALGVEGMFDQMQRIDGALDTDATYVRYSATGDHNAGVLAALDMPGPVAGALEAELASGPRLNARATQKQFAAMANAEALSERSGVALDRPALWATFSAGFRFERDRPCVLVGDAVKRDLHERTLAAALAAGFEPYLRFFADERVEPQVPLPVGQEVLDDEDLARLVESVRQPAGV